MEVEVETGAKPIDECLFQWPSDNPKLRGGKCRNCGAYSFPVAAGCERCGGKDIENVDLPDRGTLWSFTVQGFRPKEPYAGDDTDRTFRPYGVGYVELPGTLRVEARLTESDPAKLRIGQDVKLVIVPFNRDDKGIQRLTFAFAPA